MNEHITMSAVSLMGPPLTSFGCDSESYRDSARETASAASDAAMKSLSGRFGNGANPKLR